MPSIKLDWEDLAETIKNQPGTAMALGRTVLANDRTLLSYVRTWLSLLAGGLGLTVLLEHPLLIGVGWASIGVSFIVLWLGIRRFRHTNQLLARVGKEIKS